MSILYNKAKYIAENFDVATPKDCLVLFSISYLPTRENKDNAFKHIAENSLNLLGKSENTKEL